IFLGSHLHSFAASLIVCLLTGTLVADGSWLQAIPGYTLEFPRDHASHPAYKIECWNYTGNLPRGPNRVGYQLTFVGSGVEPEPKNASRWTVRGLFITYFAITDIGGKQYRFAERMNRAGAGWAGADVDRYRVWNQNWEARIDDEGRHHLEASD